MAEGFVQLPVEGSGKRLHTAPIIELTFDGGTIAFAAGDIVTGATSGVVATVIAQTAGDTTSGTLLLLPSDPSDVFFTDDEQLNVSGSPNAIANGPGIALHNQVMQIGGAEDPRQRMKVDTDGAAHVRFSDGPQLLDALGHSQVSTLTPLGTYTFDYDAQPNVMTTSSVGGGSVTYDSDNRSVLLSTDNISGSVARISSRKYHKIPGAAGIEVIGTTVANTVALAGNARRTGLFDEDNGIFFLSSGSFVGIALRSSAGGSVVDELIPASSFNGSSPSNGAFDTTKVNQFFFDINRAGRVRFGLFDPNGTRQILHTIEKLNSVSQIFLGNAELPLRSELENLAGTAGTSDLRIYAAHVIAQTAVPDDRLVSFRSHAANGFHAVTGSDHHMVTVRPLAQFKGQTNRAVGLLDEVHTAMPTDGSSIVRLRIIKNASFTSSSWTDVQTGKSAFEYSTLTGTYVPGTGTPLFETFISEKSDEVEIETHGSYIDEFISLDWDGTQNATYSAICDLVTGSNVPVNCVFDLREVH